MVNLDYCIKDVHGVHVKPVTALFKLTKGYKSVVNIVNDEKVIPFKGAMSLMSLRIKQGDWLSLTFEGPDEEEEMQAVKKFLEENL
jgi:phosphotransferase system HPr (HPr) family protein